MRNVPVALVFLLALPALAQEGADAPLPVPGSKGQVTGPIGFVQKLDGLSATGGGVTAPVVSQGTAEALALDAARKLDEGNLAGTAPLTSVAQLAAIDAYLHTLGMQDPAGTASDVFTIEHMSDAALARIIRASEKPGATGWLKNLAEVAKVEAKTRGLDVRAIEEQPLGTPRPTFAPQPFPNGPGAQVAPFTGANESDLEILARIVKGESPADAPFEEAVAVASVVLNRVRAGGYGATIEAVAHAPWQFSCYNPDQRNQLYWGPIPDYAWRAARQALAGDDPVPGCCHYINPYLCHPSWADQKQLYRRFGTSVATTQDFYVD